MWINPAVKKFYNVTSNSSQVNNIAKHIGKNISRPVCDRMTTVDKNLFQAYLFARTTKTRITPQEIKEVFSKNGNDFITSAYDLITEKFNLSKDIRPSVFMQECQGDNIMQYMGTNHCIFISPSKIKNCSKEQIYNYIRHEIQHCLQNIDILRHETLGEKAVELYAKSIVDTEKSIIENLVQMSPDKAVRMGVSIQDYINFKMLHSNPKLYQETMRNNLQMYTGQLKSLRQNFINKFGLIKEGTKNSEKVKLYFNDFMNVNYYGENNKVNIAKYLNKITEQEAILAGEIAECEVSGTCYFKKLKNDAMKSLENKELLDEIMKEGKAANSEYLDIINGNNK